MSDAKLTDAELAEALDDCDDTSDLIRLATRLIAEVRQHRALLATPMPCGWPVPFAELKFKGKQYVSWDALENGEPALLDPDEAEALGVGLVRAARKARGGG